MDAAEFPEDDINSFRGTKIPKFCCDAFPFLAYDDDDRNSLLPGVKCVEKEQGISLCPGRGRPVFNGALGPPGLLNIATG